ncbi:MAG: hypothetical protein FWD64_05780 [Acidobacteriaceae bacterium]|nr:hypothetical protein [Acidobacteriaceae bacterium]
MWQKGLDDAMVNVARVADVTRNDFTVPRIRAYFAPVNRAQAQPVVFDAAQQGRFSLDTPPAPWIDLGWCRKFTRKNGTKKGIVALRTGAPSMPSSQVLTEAEATVQLEFAGWGKLQMALTCGSQQMNLLATAAGAAPNGSGGVAAAAVPLAAGSTAGALNVGTAAAAAFSAGDMVAVDVDYTGQTGYVGSGVSAAYVQSAASVASDSNYIRRVTLNVARVSVISNGVLTLEAPLLAGAPTTAMKTSKAIGFVDREGGLFFQEWSALFVLDGKLGDRVIFHYPRLQASETEMDSTETLITPLDRMKLSGAFRALPVKDANDSEQVLCFRSYLPA